MTDHVLLACGDVAHAQHGSAHDGLPVNHPSCVVHYDSPGGIACKVVETPDLTGRLAHCAYYGSKPHNGGPIYGGGECGRDGCFCVVPTSVELPFLSLGDTLARDFCDVDGPPDTIGFDARGKCIYSSRQHDIASIPTETRVIVTRYPSNCSTCGLKLHIGSRALWMRGNFARLWHVPEDCPARQHVYLKRSGLGTDTFVCGCMGWD